MTIHPSRVLLLVTLVTACDPIRSGTECSVDSDCERGMVCEVRYGLCRSSPPVVTIERPTADERVSTQRLLVAGTLEDNTGVTQLQYRWGDGGEWSALGFAGGSFSAELPVPSMDEGATTLTVSARDAQGNEGHSTVTVTVDNLAPRVLSVTPGDGERAGEPRLVIQLSEPASLTADGFKLTPAAFIPDGGTVSQLNVPLEYGTHYVLEFPVGAFVDGFGHTSEDGGRYRFRTTPRPPPDKTSFFPGSDIKGFDAVSDGDGVATVVARMGQEVRWGRFHPETGSFELINVVSAQASDDTLQAVAGVTEEPELYKPSRVSGFVKGAAGSASSYGAYWKVNDEPLPSPRTSDTPGLVPVGPSCAESDATSAVAFIVHSGGPLSYQRPPRSAVTLELSGGLVKARDGNQWEWVEAAAGQLRRQRLQAQCGASPSQTFVYTASLATDVGQAPNLSVALAELDRALYVYTDLNGQRRELCARCVYEPTASGCSPSVPSAPAVAPDLLVASRNLGGRVLGATRMSDRTVQLLEKDLSDTCQGPWSVVGVATASEQILAFRPLMLGGRPGVVVQLSDRLQILYPRVP